MKIQIRNLNIEFDGDMILMDFSLDVKDREFVTVLGRSGTGKTTVLNIISGTVKCGGGEVLVDGKAVAGVSPHIAYMPQDDLLLPWKNILDNVTLYDRISGAGADNQKRKVRRAEARKKALEDMEAFGLKGCEMKYPSELSGGMKQRAAFLRTSLCSADTLLLDEPFASLDVMTRKEMQQWLLIMKDRLNKTVLMVTHDIDEAILLSDRIVVIGGRPAKAEKEFPVDGSRTSEEIKREIWEILSN